MKIHIFALRWKDEIRRSSQNIWKFTVRAWNFFRVVFHWALKHDSLHRRHLYTLYINRGVHLLVKKKTAMIFFFF